MPRSAVAARPAPKQKRKTETSDFTVFMCLFGAFVVGLFLIWTFVIPGTIQVYRQYVHYERTECTIIDSRIESREDRDSDGTTIVYRVRFLMEYQVGNRSYRAWGYDGSQSWSSLGTFYRVELRRFEKGGHFPCWYDPAQPTNAILVRRLSWSCLLAVIPFVMVLVGSLWIFAIIYYVKKLLAWLSLIEPAAKPKHQDANIELPDSARKRGAVLKFFVDRQTTGWGCLSACTFVLIIPLSVFWEDLDYVLAAYRFGILAFADIWWMIVLLAASGGMGYLTVRKFLEYLRVGPTVLEASEPSLYPGRPAELLIRQSGNVRIAGLKVTVCCSERAEYVEGTRTRHFSSEIFKGILADLQDITVRPGRPHDIRIRVTLPRNAMHSFDAGNNEVRWELTVNGEIDKWPDFKRSFTLPVLPVPPQEPAA